MANVLLIDASDVARKALKGILTQGGHRLATAATAEEGWQVLLRDVKIDLVITESALKGASGIEFVQRLRRHCLLKIVPAVIYAADLDRAAVRAGVDLQVQNFLVKPYVDETIFAEINKAMLNPWRPRHFEEEKSFCVLTGLKPDGLHRMLEELRTSLLSGREFLAGCAFKEDAAGAAARIEELSGMAETAGAWCAVEYLAELHELADRPDWPLFTPAVQGLDLVCRLIHVHLHPGFVPEGMLTDEERRSKEEAKERARWFEAAAQNRCPVVLAPEVERRIEALSGCPVVDTTAAMFQMLANGHPSSLIPIMEKVEKDPALAAQILIAANRARRIEDPTATVEDLRLGVELLGELKLHLLGKELITIEERLLHALPFTWPRFWMFQIAVARMARHVCAYLEFHELEGQAYTAGLLHDLGKLLLAHLYPFGWQAILAHAREHNIPTAEAELKFVGCTAREAANHFALTHGLPEDYRQVMLLIEKPDEAKEGRDLVAVVALARDLCRRNHVGHDGDQPRANALLLRETPAWLILAPRIFPGFDWDRFEPQMHVFCQDIKRELHGWAEAGDKKYAVQV
jgi:CheY-like chemotaxis protein/HD-like signal output (HDOD) protein